MESKATILQKNKLDKSPQGFRDEDIIPLLKRINQKYTTTSSCSGRITLLKGGEKGEVQWLYKTHTKASAAQIYRILQKQGALRFFFEPLIIHIQCKNKEEAEELLKCLQANGFKKAALISFRNWTIEINETGRMETILTKELSKEYITLLVREANKRLKKTKENINKLENLFTF
ncbi:hypothetical protein HZA98_00795 [Candidatus Woesearchaeota archaeon]|nr:hypothetical protein [Candidatus Woesearchaeota archaeon]